MTWKIFILILFLSLGHVLNAQKSSLKKVRVINFDQFEPYLHLRTDTVYLVNFWATWCAPCIAELPAIREVEKKYSDKKLKVFLVSLDLPRQLNTRLIPFLNEGNFNSEVLLLDDPDQNRWIDKVDKKWSGEIPFTIIYGKNFRESYTQTLTYKSLDSIIHLKLKLP